MFHLIKNNLSIRTPHRLPTEHTPALPFQCQVNAESCKKYSTIVFTKNTATNCQETEKKQLVVSQRGHQIAIAYKLRLTVWLGCGSYFVKVTTSSLMS